MIADVCSAFSHFKQGVGTDLNVRACYAPLSSGDHLFVKLLNAHP